MKGFILDSDTWIEFFRHRGGVDKHIAETPAEQIFASEVSIAELTYGALHSNAIGKVLQEPKLIESTFTVLPLGDWMRDYAEIRQGLASKGLRVGDFDILSQMQGIQCVDWVEKA